MSTIINATTTNGVVIEPDNSGSLVLQTNSGTTALTIDTSQNVGIGSSETTLFTGVAGTAKLAVTGSDSTTTVANNKDAAFAIVNTDDTTNNLAGLHFAWQDTDNSPNFAAASIIGILGAKVAGQYPAGQIAFLTSSATNNAPSEKMRITAGGEVYIAGTTDQGAYNLQCNGTGVWGAGAYVNGSDSRIKYDIQPISSSLEVVNKLNPVTFKYKEDWSKDQSVQTGFIAQELQETLKDEIYIDGLVNTGGEYLSVAYQNIIPLLTKAIQEQQTIINDLKARVETLEAKLG